MALLPILEFPDPRLRTRAEPVQQFDAALGQLIADMLQTMYAAPGIGLAATQVNVHRQLLVMDVSAEKNQPLRYDRDRRRHPGGRRGHRPVPTDHARISLIRGREKVSEPGMPRTPIRGSRERSLPTARTASVRPLRLPTRTHGCRVGIGTGVRIPAHRRACRLRAPLCGRGLSL